MIILATVIIISLTNNNIIGRASTAVNETNLKNMQEAADIALGEVILENDGSIEGVDDIESKIKTKMEANGIDTIGYNISYNNGTGKLTVSIGSNEALYTLDLSEDKDGSVIAKVYSDKTVISGTGTMYDALAISNPENEFKIEIRELDFKSYIISEIYKKYNNNNLPDDFFAGEVSDGKVTFMLNEIYLLPAMYYAEIKDFTKEDFIEELGSSEPEYTEFNNTYVYINNFSVLKAFYALLKEDGDIGDDAYAYIENVVEHANVFNGLTKIEIENGVQNIGNQMFECMTVQNVKIPSSVERIGKRAFADSRLLTNIEISEGVKQIDNEAFDGCSALTTVKIPSTVTSIGNYVFHKCDHLQSIKIIGRSIEDIGTNVVVGTQWYGLCNTGNNSGSDVIYTQ